MFQLPLIYKRTKQNLKFLALFLVYVIISIDLNASDSLKTKKGDLSLIHNTESEKKDKFSFGAKLGFNIAVYRGTKVESACAHVGFSGGLSATYHLTKRLGIQVEGLFTNKSASARYNIEEVGDTVIPLITPIGQKDTFLTTIKNDATIKMNYLEIPILLKYNYVDLGVLKSYIIAGPVFSTIINTSLTGNTEVFISDIDFPPGLGFTNETKFEVSSEPIDEKALEIVNFDFGFTIGGGTTYKTKIGEITFDLRYTHGIPDIEEGETVMRSGSFMCLFGWQF